MIVPSEPPRRTIRRLRLASVKLGRSRTENELAFCKSNRFVTVQPVHRRRSIATLSPSPALTEYREDLQKHSGMLLGCQPNRYAFSRFLHPVPIERCPQVVRCPSRKGARIARFHRRAAGIY